MWDILQPFVCPASMRPQPSLPLLLPHLENEVVLEDALHGHGEQVAKAELSSVGLALTLLHAEPTRAWPLTRVTVRLWKKVNLGVHSNGWCATHGHGKNVTIGTGYIPILLFGRVIYSRDESNRNQVKCTLAVGFSRRRMSFKNLFLFWAHHEKTTKKECNFLFWLHCDCTFLLPK